MITMLMAIYMLKLKIIYSLHVVVWFCEQKRLRMISILGAGLLVGTALAVIIPEGVHALYETQEHGEICCFPTLLTSPLNLLFL